MVIFYVDADGARKRVKKLPVIFGALIVESQVIVVFSDRVAFCKVDKRDAVCKSAIFYYVPSYDIGGTSIKITFLSILT